jgi:DNA-binding transcriptional LysR family regulator
MMAAARVVAHQRGGAVRCHADPGSVLAAFPRIRVRTNVGDSHEVVQRVLGYNSDVGVPVHVETDPRLNLLPSRKQRILIMAPRSHPLARRLGVKLKDLERQPFVMREPGSTTREVLEQALTASGVRVCVAVEIGSRE